MSFKVGEISFANFFPFRVNSLAYPKESEIFSTYPAELNKACRNSILDVSPISLFAYSDIKDEYEILSNFTIASRGVVDSVKLYSNYPISDLRGKKIFFTKKSESSIGAFVAICKHLYGFNPQDYSCDEVLESDAAFLIGDDVFMFESSFKEIFDIGKLWAETFSITMVYAVIVAKRSLPSSVKNEFCEFYEANLKEFFSDFEKYLPRIRSEFSACTNLSSSRIFDYFCKSLIYHCDSKEIARVLDIFNGKFI